MSSETPEEADLRIVKTNFSGAIIRGINRLGEVEFEEEVRLRVEEGDEQKIIPSYLNLLLEAWSTPYVAEVQVCFNPIENGLYPRLWEAEIRRRQTNNIKLTTTLAKDGKS